MFYCHAQMFSIFSSFLTCSIDLSICVCVCDCVCVCVCVNKRRNTKESQTSWADCF
ncbi:hypothetical protein ACP275_11G074200 [Erythranthe tilingii]